MASQTRKVYYDFMRICAALLVIFNHLPGYTLYQKTDEVKVWFYTFMTMITRINVPVFFMISGALLLGKQEPISQVLKNRVVRFALMMLVFSAVTFFGKGILIGKFDISGFIRDFSSGSIVYSYWYLYSYLGFLMMLPFLRRGVQNFRNEDFWYFFLIHFLIYSLIPAMNYILSLFGIKGIILSSDLKLPLMTEKMLFYPVLGYYLDRVLDLKKLERKHILLMTAATGAGILISSAITIHRGYRKGFNQDYVQMFDYLSAIVFFVLVKYMFEEKHFLQRQLGIQKLICAAGQLTLGMYLFDHLWKMLFYAELEAFLEPVLPTMIVSFVWCLVSMTLSGAAAFLLKKIPGLKQLI